MMPAGETSGNRDAIVAEERSLCPDADFRSLGNKLLADAYPLAY